MGALVIFPHEESFEGPAVFLAGPLEQVSDWQSEAIALLSVSPSVNIISPRSPELEQGVSRERIQERIKWEERYVQSVLRNGVMLFWFPKPPSPTEGYAKEALFRLGKTLSLGAYPSRSVIGVEPGLEGEVWIHEVVKAHDSSIPIFDSLEEVCDQAIRLAMTL